MSEAGRTNIGFLRGILFGIHAGNSGRYDIASIHALGIVERDVAVKQPRGDVIRMPPP